MVISTGTLHDSSNEYANKIPPSPSESSRPDRERSNT